MPEALRSLGPGFAWEIRPRQGGDLSKGLREEAELLGLDLLLTRPWKVLKIVPGA